MTDATAAAADLLYREARYLDERRWDEWLALYHEEAEFWVPAWKSEDQPTADPASEISLIYAARRAELEDRVWRVRSGQSIASVPMPRTAHIVTNVLGAADGDAIAASSIWTTHVFNVKRREEHLFFARCEHRLVQAGGALRILRRKALLLNDTLPTMLDFYTI